MLDSLSDKSPGDTGFTYSMLKAGGPSLLLLLHHHFSLLWQLHSPLTVDSALTHHPASWALHLLAPIYKDSKVPPLDRLHPKNYRGICLADAEPMVFQMGLLSALSDYVSQHTCSPPPKAPASGDANPSSIQSTPYSHTSRTPPRARSPANVRVLRRYLSCIPLRLPQATTPSAP